MRTRRISHPRTKPFMRVCMPRICACAYLTSVNQALVLTIKSGGKEMGGEKFVRGVNEKESN